jgi:hypothetical protein
MTKQHIINKTALLIGQSKDQKYFQQTLADLEAVAREPLSKPKPPIIKGEEDKMTPYSFYILFRHFRAYDRNIAIIRVIKWQRRVTYAVGVPRHTQCIFKECLTPPLISLYRAIERF